jgi:hypothetical protein
MKALLATILLLLLVTPVFAQSDRGTITGTVLDPTAAVVPGAKVIARNTATGRVSETTTTATGNYTLPSLPAGLYEVIVEMQGFRKVTRPNIQVQVAQTARVDFTLEVGAASESVTVTAEAPLLRTENAEQSMNITGDRINSLPLNFGGGGTGVTGAMRNWLSFVILAPGVSGTAYNSPINGAPGGAFKIYLEGQDVTSSNDTTWTSIVSSASVEAIGEFSLQTANFAAEFGQVLGGLFNFTTKSGSNAYHGSAYEYFANEAFDAARPFTHLKGRDRKHDFGFSAGGPVRIPRLYNGKDRTFFFFSFEGFRVNTGSSGTLGTVPTDAYRTGNFSAALTGRTLSTDGLGRPIPENGIYDPISDFIGSDGKTYRNLFTSNQIPTQRLDAVALKIQALMPKPINSNLVQNWLPNAPNHKYQTLPSLKIDHSINDTTKLSGYWSVQNTDQLTSLDGLPYPLSGVRVQQIYGHITRLNLDKSFTPRLLAHIGAGYTRFHNPDSSPPEVLQYDTVKNLGLVGSATDPAGFPLISSTSSNWGGMGQMGPNTAGLYYNDKLTAVASATYVRDNHTYKLGGEFKQEVWTDNNYYQAQGYYMFGNSQTGLPALNTTSVGGGSIGFSYASFLLGQVSSANVASPKTLQWRKKAWGLYIQDTWKVTRKLTLDYGLRWDLAGQGHELYYRVSQIGVNTPNPSAGGLPGGWVYEGYGSGRCNCTFAKTYPYAIGPRLGVAYQLNPKTVLRAGWGITYSAGANWWYVTGGSSSVGVGFNTLNFSNPAYGQAALKLSDGLHYDTSRLYAASLDPGIYPTAGMTNVPSAWGAQINDPNGGRPARVNQWNLAVQREIIRNLSVEVAYVGNRGVWLEANSLVSMNAIRPATFKAYNIDLNNAADRSLLTSRIDSAAAAARGITKPYAAFPNSATVAQALRPFPMYNNALAVRWAPLGNNWYDALQVEVVKRTSHGLDLTSSFTWQKELALGSGGNPGAGGGGINDVFNRRNQKSLTGASTPFILSIGFNYTTPKLGSGWLIRQLTGNWDFAGVLRYASGALIGVPGSNNNLGTFTLQGGTRMNRVAGQPVFLKDPGCNCIDPNKDFVLNPAAWADVPAGQWGFAAPYYNDYRWQRQAMENLNIGRTFPIREKMKFQIRLEVFNAFNRLFLGGPSSGNPAQTPVYNAQGVPTSGFGYINANNIGGQRNGQLVARFEW